VIVAALHTKKAVGSFGLPTARNLSKSRALRADLPKKAEKSEKAAHVVIPVHDMPLDESL